ncbi:MAG: M48 family metallopeptidase [Gammaproteobacteria bacterium]|nr:M48 family metallopeptidase [Gammaproteobacteria bacterium]MDH3820948.1 M48 family metallopeptidase [Gammaproteobacteria bacterium]MDH3984302.1 M48 family metallopeptidase [Gammaproteobacteria bacterium]
MRYVPKQPREGINVSDTHPLVEAGTLVVGLTAIFIAIVLALVFLIEVALYFIPAEKEAELFRDWLPDDLVTVSPGDERLYNTQRLVDRLAFHWAGAPYEFRVEIDDSEVANAMALPGGLIIVTQGLLDQVESENELAFVLGHELGHYKNRDHIRALGRGIVFSLFFTVAMGSDVAGLGLKVSDLALRGFSRKQESRADEFALAVVYTQYGHVNEAWRLFERWGDEGNSIRDLVAYLSTHPQAGDRVERLESLAIREGWPLQGRVTALQWQ